jgi:hypothetical protein
MSKRSCEPRTRRAGLRIRKIVDQKYEELQIESKKSFD